MTREGELQAIRAVGMPGDAIYFLMGRVGARPSTHGALNAATPLWLHASLLLKFCISTVAATLVSLCTFLCPLQLAASPIRRAICVLCNV
jgi:hypothetical protein